MKAYQTDNGLVVASAVTAIELNTYENKYEVDIHVGSKVYNFYVTGDEDTANSVYNGLLADLGWATTDPTSFGG